MFAGVIKALNGIAAAITAGNAIKEKTNELLDAQNKELAKIAGFMDPSRVVGIEPEHVAPEPRS